MTNFTKSYGDASYWPSLEARIIVTVIFGLVLLVGVVGNIVVILLIALDKTMHTTVNRCLFVLALADLLILIFLPILAINYEFLEDDAHLGVNMCYFLLTYDRGAIVCSILIFLFVSIDRYFAICHPLKIRHVWSGKSTYIVLAVIWIIAMASSVPYAYMVKYEWEEGNITHYYCRFDTTERWKVNYETAIIFLTTFVPIPVLVFLYGRMISKLQQNFPAAGEGAQDAPTKSGRQGRSQVMKMLLTVVSTFIVCQVPFALLIIIDYHSPHIFTWANYSDGTFALIWIVRILIYVNSAANPVVYFFMSSNFRRAFVRAFCCQAVEGRGVRPSMKAPSTQLSTIS